jgi:hypothetical protein
MKYFSQFGFVRSRNAAWAACLMLTLALCAAVLNRPASSGRGAHRAVERAHLSAAGATAISALNRHSEVRNYFMELAGDHSLDVATVTEQPSSGYARYTVQLHLASGAEQSVVVSAPPGGLQVEMHDMTGDKVQNDVILRPVLVRWLPTVLVNDGHEHFDVAVSDKDPNTFSSNEELGSRPRDTQTFALLMSSRSKSVHLPNNGRLFGPRMQENLLPFFTQTGAPRLGHALSPGRAPPLPTTI